MKLYYATDLSPQIVGALTKAGVKNYLLSYHYLIQRKDSSEAKLIELSKVVGSKLEIFLDSGAFSAFTQGVKINIDDYIKYLKKYEKFFPIYANLDVIGDAKASYDNYLYMKKNGLNPLPVFHQFEDFKYLDKYLKISDYLALGGMVGYPAKKLMPFLDTCFYYLNKKQIWPYKIHLFGISSQVLLERYPAYSFDSTSWLYAGKIGKNVVFKDGKLSGQKAEVNDAYNNILVYTRRNYKNVKAYQKLEKYLTQLWEQRGIIWEK